ncbi:glycosyltransferase family 41 protein [Ciceribacter sp. L1K22]|uniref:O-linked N-acetylglucosamine transferase, SPINDLY family protein n=1 Tax=Ciceribacter sp. L1K22 TaxID=2820275 RepID=UPI001ABDC65B|nr:glycosyltransferase family 41 protein [Ciceribacter sp. L1K22]MBO3759190.1 hypothetical protein [Ciceribacter sp. L1K22]
MSVKLQQAKRHFSDGQMQLALAAGLEAFVADRKSADAMLLLAAVQERLGDRAAAATFYAGAVDFTERHRREAAFRAATHFLAVDDPVSARAALLKLERFLPDDRELNHSLCSLYREAGDYAQALPYARRLARTATSTGNFLNAGIVLSGLDLFEEALGPLSAAYEQDPDSRLALSELFWCAANLGMLDIVQELQEKLEAGYAAEGEAIDIRENAFRAVVWSGDEDYILRSSRLTASHLLPPVTEERPAPRLTREKIRIGYVSADFCDHATMALFGGVLEHHDRGRFEVYGICHTLARFRSGPMRQRFLDAVDRYVDILEIDDEAAAAQIRALDLDILVDLKGYTHGNRLGIFCRRPAPVQITYLGFPGPVSGAGIDYAITDAIVTPPSSDPFYDEKLLRIAPSYQCNDATRPEVERQGRAAHGLPETGVVFCSFNQVQKIRPAMFAAWMDILKAVEGSVLWLADLPETVRENLRRAAVAHGVDGERLIFAPRLSIPDHLARLCEADIALDTTPYNGHTTTSDALWCGVPVVTVRGTAFAGRVSESLLGAVGLPDLVANDIPEFVRLAVELAQDGSRQTRLRQHLISARKTAPLFDTLGFTRRLEEKYEEVCG